MRRFLCSVLPAFLLAISVGQIYAFTNFSDAIAAHISTAESPVTRAQVQFAFSLGIFFLGMGAATFGKIVERNIRLSTLVGTALFVSGLLVTELGICRRSLALVYLGYGVLVGTGTGVIYISPVKTMMLWFIRHKAIAAALPIISFGLGSTLSTILYKGFSLCGGAISLRGFESLGVTRSFVAFAVFYAVPMALSACLLRKPAPEGGPAASAAAEPFSYGRLLRDPRFVRAWLFMFLNISCGLCLIPLAKQMMKGEAVGYSEGLVTAVVALSGVMNGGGRFLFAWWSDRLARRVDILLFILSISAGVMAASFWPPLIGAALLVVNACYGAGFSVIPAILADSYGMANLSKIHGAVLSAWGFAGLAGNQAAILVADRLGLGYAGVVAMLVALYVANLFNALSLRRVQSSRP